MPRRVIRPVGKLRAKTLAEHDFWESSSYIATSRPRAGATALSGRIREAGRCRRGGGTPQRRSRVERRSKAAEIRRLLGDEVGVRTKIGTFTVYILQSK